MEILPEVLREAIYEKKYKLEFDDVIKKIGSIIYLHDDGLWLPSSAVNIHHDGKYIRNLPFCNNCGGVNIREKDTDWDGKRGFNSRCKCWIIYPDFWAGRGRRSLNVIDMKRQPQYHQVPDSDSD